MPLRGGEGGGGGRIMAKTILNFHFDYLTTPLIDARYWVGPVPYLELLGRDQ